MSEPISRAAPRPLILQQTGGRPSTSQLPYDRADAMYENALTPHAMAYHSRVRSGGAAPNLRNMTNEQRAAYGRSRTSLPDEPMSRLPTPPPVPPVVPATPAAASSPPTSPTAVIDSYDDPYDAPPTPGNVPTAEPPVASPVVAEAPTPVPPAAAPTPPAPTPARAPSPVLAAAVTPVAVSVPDMPAGLEIEISGVGASRVVKIRIGANG